MISTEKGFHMKSLLISGLFLLLFSSCLEKGSSIKTTVTKNFDSIQGWKACYSEPIIIGGKSVQSISHHLTFTETEKSFYNLQWKFSEHTEKGCKGPKKEKGEMRIENIFIDLREGYFNISILSDGSNSPKHLSKKQKMFPPFAYYKKLKLYQTEYNIYFDYKQSVDEDKPYLALFYLKEEGSFEENFYFSTKEDENKRKLVFH